MKSAIAAVLLVLGVGLPRTLAAKERAPYLEAAFGLGFFSLKAALDDGESRAGDFGTLFMSDLRLFPLAAYGMGLRVSVLSGASLLG